MNLFKRKPDGFYRGLGAEFTFDSKDGVVVISGGRILRIGLQSGPEGSNSARIVVEGADRELVLHEGDIRETSRRFEEISRAALAPRAVVSVPRKGLYAVLAAFTALSLLMGFYGAQTVVEAPAEAAISQDVGRMLGGLVPPTNVPFASAPVQAPPQEPVPALPEKPQAKASAIFDKPSFLSLNEDEPKADAKPSHPAGKSAQDEKSAQDAASVPAYREGMYDKPAPQREAPKNVPAPTSGKTVAAPDVSASVPPIPAAPAASQTDEDVVKSLEEKAAAATVPAKTETPAAITATAPAHAVGPQAEASPKKDDGLQTPASKLTASLVSTGMQQAKAVEVAAQLEQLAKLGGEQGITPEMLAQLPHDVAKILKENGLLENMEKPASEGGVPYAIIRLPESVIDKFRGKDGIPAIPLNDSYAALGNKVSIPLPGGGDVKEPQDLEAFGFKP